jgi:mannose-6-phosphate isomerase
MEILHPFTVAPRAVEAVWGGQRLRDLLGRDLPADRPIGETWEVHDQDRVESGPLADGTLAEAVARAGERLLGTRGGVACGPTRAFPLLIKFIDAAGMLSVQVHPTDDDEPGCGKTEAYYVLEARPGAKLYYGLTPETDRAALRRAVEQNVVERNMQAIEVSAGDVVYTPAGTVHAFGGGLVFYEIQQCSTITYRLYDWGRVGIDGRPRELHVEQSLRAARFPQPPARRAAPLLAPDRAGERRILAAGPHFALEELARPGASHLDGRTFHLLTSLGGASTVVGDCFGPLPVEHSRTLIVPATAGDYRYAPPAGGRLLRSYVPDLPVDVVAPLRAVGHADDRIALLGEPFAG